MSDPDHEFRLSETVAGTVHVIAVSGQADLHNAPELRGAIASAIDGGARRLVIDLTETTFIDSMTLGVLLGGLKRLAPVGGRMAVACPNGHVRRIFEITSLDQVLDVVDTTADAISLTSDGQPAA